MVSSFPTYLLFFLIFLRQMGSWGEQFSTGDQSNGKIEFWRSGYQICPSCKKKNMNSKDHVAGCRHNGDGYGTTVYTCGDCGWVTSYQYDEASSPYYYETSNYGNKSNFQSAIGIINYLWPDKPVVPRTLPDKPLDEEGRRKFTQMSKIGAPNEAVTQMMICAGYSQTTIESFLKELK